MNLKNCKEKSQNLYDRTRFKMKSLSCPGLK